MAILEHKSLSYKLHRSTPLFFAGVLFGLTLLSGLLLSIPKAFAETVTLNVNINAVCSLTIDRPTHSATINPGDSGTIGTSTIKSTCNDPGGLAVYAIGYTNDTYGNTNLTASTGGNTYDIATNATPTGTTPSASEWNMTLTAITGTYTPTIVTGFDSAHAIPSQYTKVAYRDSMTDIGSGATGANFTATFNATISATQAAGTYHSKVKFTLVHPSLHEAPSSRPATLDTGSSINVKLKNLAQSSLINTTTTNDFKIKSFSRADSLPSGFAPSAENTISTSNSNNPVYIFFDDTNSAGQMYYYSEANTVYANPDSSCMFKNLNNLAIIDLTDFNTSDVTDMNQMFNNTGMYSATPTSSFSLDLSGWDTSSVTNMGGMFANTAEQRTDISITGLSGWDTSSVTDMHIMFSGFGKSATTFSLDLSGWDTSSVTDMGRMFEYVGSHANVTSFSLNLSGWDVSSVSTGSNIFDSAGEYAANFSLNLSDWNTSNAFPFSYLLNYTGSQAGTLSLNLSGWVIPSTAYTSNMFYYTGSESGTFSLNLSGWDISNATNLNYDTFYYAGYEASVINLDFSNWKVSNTPDLKDLFYSIGYNATGTISLDVSNWDLSNTTDLSYLFDIGYYATTFSIDLSGWDTSSVTNMSDMFSYAGYSATTWSVTIPATNGGSPSISNDATHLYGSTSSTFASPDSGRTFTIRSN